MTKDELWQAVLGELELTLSRANFITWFKNTFIVAEENEKNIIYKIEVYKNYEPVLANKTIGAINESTDKSDFLININNSSGLNPKYTFEKFIVGKNNELAHAAAKAIGD